MSDEPINTDAERAAELSGPQSEKSSVIAAVAPLPEIGRTVATGKSSGGIPSALHTGDAARHKASIPPLAENIFTATIRSMRVGKRS